jgi:hypothetical protein
MMKMASIVMTRNKNVPYLSDFSEDNICKAMITSMSVPRGAKGGRSLDLRMMTFNLIREKILQFIPNENQVMLLILDLGSKGSSGRLSFGSDEQLALQEFCALATEISDGIISKLISDGIATDLRWKVNEKNLRKLAWI